MVDHTLGRELKNGVRDYFWSDFESSFERTKYYCEDIKEREWRILLTWWTWRSWEKISEGFTTQDLDLWVGEADSSKSRSATSEKMIAKKEPPPLFAKMGRKVTFLVTPPDL